MSEKARLTECVYCKEPTIRQTARCSACFRVEHFVQSNIALVLQVLDRLGIERLEWVPGPPVENGQFLVQFMDGTMLVCEEWTEGRWLGVEQHARLKPPSK